MIVVLLLTPLIVLGLLALLGFIGCSFQPGRASISPPPNLRAVAGDTWVQLSWDSIAATDYKVYRGETSGNYPTVTDLGGTPLSFLDAPVSNGTTYFYAVTAVADGSESGYSNEVMATPGAINFVQLIQKDLMGTGDTVTSNPFNAPLTAGNLLIVWIWYQVGSAGLHCSGVSDSANNQYTGPIVGPTAGAGALAGFQQEIWYAKNINAGTAVTVTANFSGTVGERAVSAHEYSGADTVNPAVNMPITEVGNSANATIGPLNTGAARLIFAAALFPTQGTSGPGYTQRSTLQQNATEDRRITLPGSFTATFTNTAQDWLAQMVTFK